MRVEYGGVVIHGFTSSIQHIEYTPYAIERTHAAIADPYYIATIAGDEHGSLRKREDSKVPIQARIIQARISGSPDRSNGPDV